MTIKRNFVFVVFNDPVVVGVVDFLAGVLAGRRSSRKSRPHLTIQGPYESKVSLDQISSIKQRLRQDVFFIGNPGMFETERGVALFLRVSSDNLARVWNKPDFPVSVHGFNPHITLYEGADEGKAERAFAFLKRNRVELICRDFDVVQYVPKQLDLFPQGGVEGSEDAISILMGRGKIEASFRAAFLAAVNNAP